MELNQFSCDTLEKIANATKDSPAMWAYSRLMGLLKSFEEKLSNDYQAAILFPHYGEVDINEIGFWNPDMLIFTGSLLGKDHAPLCIVQHTTELNLLLVAVQRKDDTSKPRRKIGFVVPPEPLQPSP